LERFLVLDRSGGNGLWESLLGPDGDGPDKAEQLSSDCGVISDN
jgi:hypothetical protein